MMKKLLTVVTVIFLLCGMFAGCNNAENAGTEAPDTIPQETEPPVQHFSKDGVNFTLPTEFKDHTGTPLATDCNFLYSDGYIGLLGIQGDKAAQPETVTDLATYAADQAAALGGEAVQKDGIWSLVYEDPSQNETQIYICAFYEAENCYWTIKAYCPADMQQTYEETMWDYVTSPTFE